MKQVLILIGALLTLIACTKDEANNFFLSFVESSPEGEYPVRMLITDRWLRIEDGDGQNGFILYDRANHSIHSVSHEARSILVVKSRPVTLEAPASLTHRRETGTDKPPSIGGKTVTHYRYFTSGKHCFDVYAAHGFLPDATRALREYQEAMAGEQGAMQARMPPSMQQACDMADLVFEPGRSLMEGFPVRLVKANGVTRQLTDYKINVELEPRLFELPPEYKTFSPEGVGGV